MVHQFDHIQSCLLCVLSGLFWRLIPILTQIPVRDPHEAHVFVDEDSRVKGMVTPVVGVPVLD